MSFLADKVRNAAAKMNERRRRSSRERQEQAGHLGMGTPLPEFRIGSKAIPRSKSSPQTGARTTVGAGGGGGSKMSMAAAKRALANLGFRSLAELIEAYRRLQIRLSRLEQAGKPAADSQCVHEFALVSIVRATTSP